MPWTTTGYQPAYGGRLPAGTSQQRSCRRSIPGYQKFDLFPDGPDHKGDLDAAKKSLEAVASRTASRPTWPTGPSGPRRRPTAERSSRHWSSVGIKLTLKPYPQGDYFALYAGKPPYVVKNKLGLALNGWAADWPDGFGFLSADRRQPGHPCDRWILQHQRPHPGGRQDARQCADRAQYRQAQSMWGEIDKRVMQDAVIYPGIYSKSLLVRSKNGTNIFVTDAYGEYDYLGMGAQK